MKARASFSDLPPLYQDAIRHEAENLTKDAEKQFEKKQKRVICWLWAVVLWHMHEKWGFGATRLKRLIDGIYNAWQKAEDKYELDEKMRYGDLCEQNLRHIGIDVQEIYKRFED